MEIGILLALFSAFTSTLRESVRKHISSDFTSIEIGYLGQVYGTVLLFPVASFLYLQQGFNWSIGVIFALIVSGGVVISSTYIYIEAMRISDFSVTEPLRQTTPIFVAILEPIILGISFEGTIAVGALLGTVGSYIMVSENSLRKPLENMKNKGGLMSVLVALIFAVWALASRFGATNSHPILFTYFTYLVSLFGFWIWKEKESTEIQLETYFRKDIAALGFVTALSALVAIYAYAFISASEVTVIKQMSGIFGVFIGGKYFREEDLIRKLIGALIIVSGVVLVVI